MNTRKRLYTALKLIVVATLVLSFLNQTPEVSAIASKASLKSNVTVYLYNKQLMPSDQGQVALVTLMIDNQSSSEVELIDYWARIKGKNNSYVTKLSKQDEAKVTVLPGNQEYLTYYANVSNTELITDMSVDVIKWDFAQSNYEAVVGNLVISEVSQPNVNEVASLRIGEIQLTTILEDQFIYEDIDNKVISYRMKLTNELNRAADISTFASYAIINKTDVYEGNTVISETVINGKNDVYLYGQVSIPKDMTIDAMNIALVDKHNEDLYPLLVFPVDTLLERTIDSIEKDININIGGNSYVLSGEGITAASEGNRAVVELPFKITNKSKNTGKLEEIVFYVKTKSGLIYSLSHAEDSPAQLLPEIEESFKVNGFVPNEQALIDGQLLIGLKVNEKEVIVKNVSLGNLDIKEPTDTSVITSNGQEVHFERLTRIPNLDHDLIVAEFEVKNVSKDSKKPLALTGQFVIDGVKIDSEKTKIVRMNSNLTLQPNESERVIAYFNVPFTQTILDYKFELAIDGKQNRSIAMPLSQGSRMLADNEKYQLKTIGKRGEVNYLNSVIYTGTKDDLFVVNLSLKNIEKRNITPAKLSGFIQTKNGEIYQLSFEDYEQSIMPNGVVVLSGSTPIPKALITSDLTIHFGEQLQEEDVIYIDPIFVNYKPFNHVYHHLVNMVNVGDKKFWVWNTLKNWIMPNGTDIQGLEVTLDYQIDEAQDALNYIGKRDLLVEYQDLSMTTIRMQENIPLSSDMAQLGRGTIKFTFNSPNILYESLVEYNINVYEVYKGYKRQVATQRFSHN